MLFIAKIVNIAQISNLGRIYCSFFSSYVIPAGLATAQTKSAPLNAFPLESSA